MTWIQRRPPTGFVRVIERSGGPVFYAQIRTADGRRLQKRLGRAWIRRSRPPEGFITRAQAELQLAEILAGRNADIGVEPGPGDEVTFRQACEEWMRYIEIDRKRRPSTTRDYRREIEKRLLPEFGEQTPLSAITTAEVEAFRERMVAEGVLSARTINKRLQQLHSVFKRAQRVWELPTNPVANAERQPQRRSGDFAALEPHEVELLAEHAVTEQDGVLFTVAAFTGLRLGELRGLRWADIDWTRRVVFVRRSYTVDADGPTKSGKVRSVPLVDHVACALDQVSRRELWTSDEDRVFVNDVGEHIEDSALRRRFYRALEAAGLPHIRFHDLRHTFGTIAVQAFPLTDVKGFMGHADIQTTMIYVHHVPQHDAADRLSRLLEDRTAGASGCTPGAREPKSEEAEEPESRDLQDDSDAGGGTRTPDTRIMIPLL
jgi:integrase